MVNSTSNNIYITNLTIEKIKDPKEWYTFFQKAQRNRATTATRSNERLSRSHLVMTLRIRRIYRNEVSVGLINLIDLAGSVRLSIEECATLETKCINKSLANLSNVILALKKYQEHIPYRNSKLTHLLMPSLGGKSKIIMIINISPLEENINETINSLRFALIVNNCTTGAVQRNRTRDTYL
ncbi:protein claret segregational-like [Solenopsis invicta]|nr:protein claret segregational-like [Solenopsis invicta]